MENSEKLEELRKRLKRMSGHEVEDCEDEGEGPYIEDLGLALNLPEGKFTRIYGSRRSTKSFLTVSADARI